MGELTDGLRAHFCGNIEPTVELRRINAFTLSMDQDAMQETNGIEAHGLEAKRAERGKEGQRG